MSGLKIVVAGPGGRMGQVLLRAVGEDDACVLSGQFGSKDDPLPSIAGCQALIDFTRPAASVALAALAAQARIVHVIGTTGFSDDDEAKIRAAARHAVIVKSGNMSLGVNLLAALVKQAAKALPGYDLRIFEMHHRHKVDAPSGTALMLGQASERNDVAYASLRAGSIVGEHQVILAGPGERVVLSHGAEDRMIFARGAVAAAKWGQGRKPGLYAMADVLGLS
ncbi:MAG TPA: dihydrodipicolinate reductase C-terminal domain-containing protein [Rhizomicrobium sp.]|nr:dihydrodipicolinate reductase C-terminal domain-containing protein [Rhizomicrobium sp.]